MKPLPAGRERRRPFAAVWKRLKNMGAHALRSLPLGLGLQAQIRTPKPLPDVQIEVATSWRVEVENTGRETWSAEGDEVYYLTCSWRDADGRRAAAGEVRAPLPGPVPPGGTAVVTALVEPPARPGSYRLEFALIRDGKPRRDGRGRIGRVIRRLRARSLAVSVPVEVRPYVVPADAAGKPTPIPPPDLLFRSTGSRSPRWYVESGDRSYREFAEALAGTGRSFAEFSAVLDFGCGCGRVLRAFRSRTPGVRLCASDQDAAAVAWIRENYPDMDVRANGPLPPLPFAAESFDLVLCFSVFTHLDEAYQDAWLDELRRITRPGAVLLVTVHGRRNWERTLRDNPVLRDAPDRPRLEAELGERGFSFWSGEGWSAFFPDFYHTSWHLPDYLRTHWGRWFRVQDVGFGKALDNQDIVVLRRD